MLQRYIFLSERAKTRQMFDNILLACYVLRFRVTATTGELSVSFRRRSPVGSVLAYEALMPVVVCAGVDADNRKLLHFFQRLNILGIYHLHLEDEVFVYLI